MLLEGFIVKPEGPGQRFWLLSGQIHNEQKIKMYRANTAGRMIYIYKYMYI